ncbi:uncharacterized protein G2W53_032129 [Senna tora]|uniref:Uncharacterized protein n=1 Tax=Senna tora TaxID=362788 RepID=A0A834SX19_9FABA|nr:uncharacterized protein G2W53_032129 [Senna tora]
MRRGRGSRFPADLRRKRRSGVLTVTIAVFFVDRQWRRGSLHTHSHFFENTGMKMKHSYTFLLLLLLFIYLFCVYLLMCHDVVLMNDDEKEKFWGYDKYVI